MDANDLARWTRFATKGGIGTCTALQDCVAQGDDDLMFLKDDDVVVLLQLPQEDQYLGYCEGVVGRFSGSAVRFHGKLKKPVFAKRQSSIAPSPSRPISVSPHSPSANSSTSGSASTSRPVISPTSSPRIPLTPSLPTAETRPSQPAPSVQHRGPSHSRAGSTASSSSHYSTHRSTSKFPESKDVNAHARRSSTASGHSVTAPPPRPPDPGLDEPQHVSLPPRQPPTVGASTPALTDASSVQSSFLLTPMAAFPTISPVEAVPLSHFHGLDRSGSEELSSREELWNIRMRSDRENSLKNARRMVDDDGWNDAGDDTTQEVTVQEALIASFQLPTGASEGSFQTTSMYSEPSPVDTDGQSELAEILEDTFGKDHSGILREDDSGEDPSRAGDDAISDSGFSDLSDGGFGIGMTLLREEDGDESDEDENSETEINEITVPRTKESGEVQSSPKTPRTIEARDVIPSTIEPVLSNDKANDDSPKSQRKSPSMSVSSRSRLSPADRAALPSSSSPSTMGSHGTSSIAYTEEERWESDGDIYDDYRYSRYSSHSQHGSLRSRGSMKSARSRVGERPPLPDEDSWRRGGEDGVRPTKNMTDKQPRSTTDLASGTSPPQHTVTPLLRPSTPPNQSVEGLASTDTRDAQKPRLSFTSAQSTEESVSVGRNGTLSLTTSITSPLTNAFRTSDASLYDATQEGTMESVEQESAESAESSTFSTPRHKTGDSQATLSKDTPILTMASAPQPQLSILTSRSKDEHEVTVLNESPTSMESGSPTSPDGNYLRVISPQSHSGSVPPSPLNPGFPPSPSTMTSFAATTAPLTVPKSPSPSSSPPTPRHPISPPAIPFVGIPPPGRPPSHMQNKQEQPFHSQLSQWNPGQHKVPPSESLHSALHLAGQKRATTIHGHIQKDLLSSMGPVPISFLLPGAPTTQPSSSMPPRLQPAAPFPSYGRAPQPGQKGPVSESQPQATPASQPPPSAVDSQRGRRPVTVSVPAPAPARGAENFSKASIVSQSNSPSPDARRSPSAQGSSPDNRSTIQSPQSSSTGTPLPRANFSPTVGRVRPRSRSFSGFNSEITEKESQTFGRRSQEEGNQALRISTTTTFRSSSVSPKTSTPVLAPSPTMSPSRGRPGQSSRQMLGPSPLSQPPTTNNSPISPLAAHNTAPPSPVARFAVLSPSSSDNQEPHAKRGTLHKLPSHMSLRPTQEIAPGSPSITLTSSLPSHNSGPPKPQFARDDGSLSLTPPSPLKSPTFRPSLDSDRTQSSFTLSENSTPSSLMSTHSINSPATQSGSHRSKLSKPAGRGKGSARSIREGPSETLSSTNGPTSPTDEDTVQIKDMEFELVRPVIVRGSSEQQGNDGSSDPKEGAGSYASDSRQDSLSVHSGKFGGGRPSLSSDARPGSSLEVSSNTRRPKPAESNTSVQAHRDRELKWMSTINSGDAAQSRKSKKIKKLLVDGVPSSVRYLVWAHLSDSGSRKMPKLYAQLSKRRPAVAHDIERDVRESFPDHQHLRDPNGPLVSVLFAYIAMVPDLRYSRGLAIIAGNLLLQSPEEDAFWTFLALMDGHIRPYFMPTSTQMAVDTSLFIKAVEDMDSQLAKHVFSELSVHPQDLCCVWFSSIFARSLPSEHLHRVWDLFLYDGVPFLIRVGLAILSLSRKHLAGPPKGPPAFYTGYLIRPPLELLPADPEQFISLALSMKLKDEEIRKTRIKVAAKQRAPRMSTSQSSHPHLTSDWGRSS